MKVGVVGLGAMGSGMAANLAKGGAAPKVWDRQWVRSPRQ